MSYFLRILCALLALCAANVHADEMMMVRSRAAFEEAMLRLQTSIGEHGYTVARVQRVDIGLTESGYQTDKYRIVFFAKPAELRELSTAHPDLIPYLPLKVTIFAEGDDTLVASFDPTIFGEFVTDPQARLTFERWKSDLTSILEDVREAR